MNVTLERLRELAVISSTHVGDNFDQECIEADNDLQDYLIGMPENLLEMIDELTTLRAEVEQLRQRIADADGQEPVSNVHVFCDSDDSEGRRLTWDTFDSDFKSLGVGKHKLYSRPIPQVTDHVEHNLNMVPRITDQEKADLIMGFVNQIAAAYEAGFTPYPHMTLQQLHRVAQHHVKDELGLDTDDFQKSFGAELFNQCRAISAGWDKPVAGRITKHDAREILKSWIVIEDHLFDVWLRDRGYELLNKLNADRAPEKCRCELCKGTRGGVYGNENTIDGKLVCDNCHAEMLSTAPDSEGE